MKLNVEKRNGSLLTVLEVSKDTTVDQLKDLFYKDQHYYPERQRFTTVQGKVLTDGKLDDYELKDNSVIKFKDLGVQMSWRLVFVMEYLGPILIAPIFYFLQKPIYGKSAPHSLCQKLGFWLIITHFLKRELESLFVHRFSHGTMSIGRLPINCFHYWILCGLNISYFLFHPDHRAPYSNHISLILAGIMLVFEFCNAQTHLILRNLRPRNSKVRAIPHGFGFGMISCANYFWETMSWVSFCLMTNTLLGWVFLAVAFGQMADWAMKKHKRYRKEFKDYPANRKAIIPFLL